MQTRIIEFAALTGEQAMQVLAWRNAPETRVWMFNQNPISIEEHRAFLETLPRDDSKKYWLVEPHGVVSVSRLSKVHGHGFLGIYANPDRVEKGSGAVLIRVLLEKFFEEMRMHTLKAEVMASNGRAIAFYEKHGFKHEGILKEFLCVNGQYLDYHVLGMTVDGYAAYRAMKPDASEPA